MAKQRQKKIDLEPADKRTNTFVVRTSSKTLEVLNQLSNSSNISRNELVNKCIDAYPKYIKLVEEMNQLKIPFEYNKKV